MTGAAERCRSRAPCRSCSKPGPSRHSSDWARLGFNCTSSLTVDQERDATLASSLSEDNGFERVHVFPSAHGGTPTAQIDGVAEGETLVADDKGFHVCHSVDQVQRVHVQEVILLDGDRVQIVATCRSAHSPTHTIDGEVLHVQEYALLRTSFPSFPNNLRFKPKDTCYAQSQGSRCDRSAAPQRRRCPVCTLFITQTRCSHLGSGDLRW